MLKAPPTRDELVRLIAAGHTQRGIGLATGYSQGAVKNWLKRHGLATETRDKPSCLRCGERLPRKARLFCSNDCQMQHAYEAFITAWKAGEEDGVTRGDVASKHIKRYVWEKFGGRCTKCGWCEVNPHTGKSPLHVEHKDGNGRNNAEGNLDLLCPNCHSLTASFAGANRGNGRPERRARYKPVPRAGRSLTGKAAAS